MNNESKKYKILCFPTPASGHNNPLYPILNELAKNTEIIVYTHEKFKANFENIGAIYRNLNIDEQTILANKPLKKKEFRGFLAVRNLINFSIENSEYIAKEIDKEKPDLILYDVFASYVKWALVYYKKCYNENKGEFRPTRILPPLIAYNPSLVMVKS